MAKIDDDYIFTCFNPSVQLIGRDPRDSQTPNESSTLNVFPPDVSAEGAGEAAPAGRHSGQTVPPAGTENARCGPGAPQRAQSASAGA